MLMGFYNPAERSRLSGAQENDLRRGRAAGYAKRYMEKSPRYYFWAMVVFATAVTLAGASKKLVSPVDASIRAVMARNIVETGKWYPPVFNGETMVDHPPGYIWSIAASFKIFGINDFAAQFPGRLAAFLCLLLTWFTARRLGLSPLASFFAVFILGTTRDFIIIAMQGGIEPLLSLWCWLAFYLLLPENPGGRISDDRRAYLATASAAVCVVLAGFTKGPPAFLPLLFGLAMIAVFGGGFRGVLTHLAVYLLGIAVAGGFWALYILKSGDLWYWRWYWNEQVLGSALKGRNTQLTLNPWYFFRVIAQGYWPWLPLLLLALWLRTRQFFRSRVVTGDMAALALALGFFGGFSIVKWKYWYYIAPAFPGFALPIAAALAPSALFVRFAEKIRFEKSILVISIVWILIAAIFPVKLSSNRLAEVQVFKETLKASPVAGHVWFVNHSEDYNMYEGFGEWYFHRNIKRVADAKVWQKSQTGQLWVLTGAENFRTCAEEWCTRVTFSQTSGPSTLALVDFSRGARLPAR